MKLHFPWDDIKKAHEEIRTASLARSPYEEETGNGHWLVGDLGVYLMPKTPSASLMTTPESHPCRCGQLSSCALCIFADRVCLVLG